MLELGTVDTKIRQNEGQGITSESVLNKKGCEGIKFVLELLCAKVSHWLASYGEN